jgi:hypothetical protein
MKVGKVKEATRCPDGERIRGIEAEKPDTGSVFDLNVEPQIEFGKSGEVR